MARLHCRVCAGAGDDASNIGVMLELAHNLVATPAEQLPPVPVMFLFSGAEEPLCQVRGRPT
jgi:Zn-dependent M28 family amino/carboxypeptidase